MSLYSKKLTSLDALRQEKQLLETKAEDTIDNLFSTDENKDTKSDKDFGVNEAVQTGLDFLTSKGILSDVLALVVPILDLAKIKLDKKMMSGYLKWETLKVIYKIVSDITTSKPSKK